MDGGGGEDSFLSLFFFFFFFFFFLSFLSLFLLVSARTRIRRGREGGRQGGRETRKQSMAICAYMYIHIMTCLLAGLCFEFSFPLVAFSVCRWVFFLFLVFRCCYCGRKEGNT